MKHEGAICYLLYSSIYNNIRAYKEIISLAKSFEVHVFYINPSPEDQQLFKGKNVLLQPVDSQNSLLRRHLFIYKQGFNFISPVLNSGIDFKAIYCADLPTFLAGKKIAQKLNAKLILDSFEIYLETVNQFYPVHQKNIKAYIFKQLVKLIRFLGQRIEKKCIESCDLFITTNISYLNYFLLKYRVGFSKVVMNCPEYAELGANKGLIANTTPALKGKKIVLYQGLLNQGRGLHQLVKSAKYFPEDIALVIIGYGILEKELIQLKEDLEIKHKVFFLGAIPMKLLHHYTQEADVGVLILEPFNLSKKLASANKLFEYMMSGIPLLVTDLPENKHIIEACECGVLLPETHPKVIAKSVTQMLNNENLMNRYSENGIKHAQEKFNWEYQENILLASIGGILK